MNSKHIAIALVAVLAVAAAGALFLYQDEDVQYSIRYELNGGEQNPLNPTEYTPGQTIELYDAYYADGEKAFVSWYLDSELTQPVESISSDSTGDITLYAGWSETLAGKALKFSVEGTYGSGWFSSYSLDGTISYEYLSYDQEKGYLQTISKDIGYSSLLSTFRDTGTDTDWSGGGDSDITWTQTGAETIDTINGPKECVIMTGSYPDGSYEKQWIGDGWIPYKIELKSTGTFSSTYLVLELIDVYNVDTVDEVNLSVYADDGLTVSGSGTYDPGDTVTLVAKEDKGSSFAGWYSSDGELISTSSTCTVQLGYTDTSVYAMNTVDPDVELDTGESLSGREYSETCVWNVYDSDGSSVATFTGDPSAYVFYHPGDYTVMSADVENGTYRIFTIQVEGNATIHYEWKWNGETYTCSLDILYSDVEYYRDYYDVSQRQQDIYGGHQRDMTFVTYTDKYIVQLAEILVQMTEGLSDYQRVDFVLAFCQGIGYEDDQIYMGYEEYWKFPLETLYDHGGDCEDTSILMAALCKAMGYDCCLLLLPGHMAVGVVLEGDPPIEGAFHMSGNLSGPTYYYCETTSPDFRIGMVPSNVNINEGTMVLIS